MLEMQVIEPSESAYSSTIVLVMKKKTFRFCIDLRALNRITLFDAETMPNIEELFSKLSGHKFFSWLDLSKGYCQVPLSEESKHKAAFRTPRGLFQLRVIEFGLDLAPATLTRLMRKLMKGMDNLDNYLYDIFVFKETFKSHLLILRQFFKVEKYQIN